jgi:TnpA family transposase
VLDGLLENETVLRPREHMTDTHGYTEQLFGLCHLLGYAFMPRLADLKDHRGAAAEFVVASDQLDAALAKPAMFTAPPLLRRIGWKVGPA